MSTNCKNCGSVIGGSFCSHCGQKADTHRVTLGHVVHETLHAFTHADKGFLLLIRELITKPGIVAREYLEGKRKKYFNPLSFLVLTWAIWAYVSHVTGFAEVYDVSQHANQESTTLAKEVGAIASHQIKFLGLILITPLFALLSWLFYFRSKYNFAENFVLTSFMIGETDLFRTVVLNALFLLFPHHARLLTLTMFEPIFICYFAVAYRQFFQQHILLTIVKTILIRVLVIALYWIIIYAFVYVKHLWM